ncbi:hypothetical protein HZS80_15800 [Halomonas glaciei]|uniref:Uncharacterized protein n=2 Tax=Vreelandella TaxID=3137766 RepID=A0A7Z0LV41_9GAMM|nr:hypothetical protein [Halomonas glaciei]NYS79161.1 hypothetical protein [Halomonas glaciei]
MASAMVAARPRVFRVDAFGARVRVREKLDANLAKRGRGRHRRRRGGTEEKHQHHAQQDAHPKARPGDVRPRGMLGKEGMPGHVAGLLWQVMSPPYSPEPDPVD